MAHSTKLFQKPGSPLIQGHSKTERSYWGEWSKALLASVVIAFGVNVYVELDPQIAFGSAQVWDAASATLLLFVPGALLGAALGVSVSRGFGWRRCWPFAVVTSLLAGYLSTLGLGFL